jgi:hypothetical protein
MWIDRLQLWFRSASIRSVSLPLPTVRKQIMQIESWVESALVR